MARPNKPKIEKYRRTDGTTYYTTRLMVGGERCTIQLGDERDGATPRAEDGGRCSRSI